VEHAIERVAATDTENSSMGAPLRLDTQAVEDAAVSNQETVLSLTFKIDGRQSNIPGLYIIKTAAQRRFESRLESLEATTFDETMQKTNTWPKEISETLGSDRHRAYQVLRAVPHCLRNRLIVDEVAELGDQRRTLVRGFYYEAWQPSRYPVKIRSQEDFSPG
jgi:hypothetical protein